MYFYLGQAYMFKKIWLPRLTRFHRRSTLLLVKNGQKGMEQVGKIEVQVKYQVSKEFWLRVESNTDPCNKLSENPCNTGENIYRRKGIDLPLPKTKFSLVIGFLSTFCHSLCKLDVTDRMSLWGWQVVSQLT